MKSVTEIVENVIALAREKSSGEVEAYASQVRELEVEVSDGEIENLQQASEIGVSVRILDGARLGFAYTTDFSQPGLESVIQEALQNSKVVMEDKHHNLPGSQEYSRLDLLDQAFSQVSVEDKIKMAKEIEVAAKSYDHRVKKVRMSQYSERLYQVAIANSLGLVASYEGSGFSGSLMAIAEENGVSETGWGFNFSHKLRDIDPVKIGQEAARRSVEMLGAKKVASQKADIIFDPVIGAEFLGVIAPALTGDSVQKGKSLFFDKIGRQVASSVVNLIDDGREIAGAAAAPFDDEGVPAARTELVKDGELQGFLHNLYTAAKAGVEPTGNGMRSSFRGQPESSPSNFYIQPGFKSAQEIIAEVKKGLYVTSVMGMHTANPISGDFSLGASGLWIEDGEFAYPVRGVAIAGNLVDFLKSVVQVGSDLRFTGSYGAPTIQVAGISISG